MNQETSVKIVKSKKRVVRPGFSDRFHCVTFELAADGLTPLSCHVWAHQDYPEGDLERVARRLLSRYLLDLAKTAEAGSFSELEIDALWEEINQALPVEAGRNPSVPRPVGQIENRTARIARYVLDGHKPVPCDDLATWTSWMATPKRWVQNTQLSDSCGNQVRICTAFLGLDMNFGIGETILFETMVLGGIFDRELYRYCTWTEAKQEPAKRCRSIRTYKRHENWLAVR
jgi:hypothetical protein